MTEKNDEIKIEDEQSKEVETSIALAVKYESLVIKNNDEYETAGETLKQVRGAIKKLENMRLEKTRPLDALKKSWKEFFDKPINKLEIADEAISKARRVFFTEMEAQRRAEQAKVDELARKEAERLAKRADKAEEKGQDDKAEILRAQAQQVEAIAPVIASKVVATAGISNRTNWKYEIVDESKLPRKFLIADTKKIGEQVRALKNDCVTDFASFGIRVYSEIGENVR